MQAARLRSIGGVDELLRHRGIHLVEPVKAAGQTVDWRHGTLAYVAIVHGSGADHDDVLRLVRLTDRTLRIEYAEEDEGKSD